MKVIGRIGSGASTAVALCGLGLASLTLSGCMSSPTYGTDKTASEQLFDDVSGILSLAPPKRETVAYTPRPELVRPAKGEVAELPEPQDSVVAGNQAWPESPEAKRARLRADADANRDTPGWTPAIEQDVTQASLEPREKRQVMASQRYQETGATPLHDTRPTPDQQRKQFKARLAESRQGNPTTRKYLSEPPLVYREPAATAPTDDVGEDELKKERRLKAAAKKNSGKSFADLWPF